MAELGGKRARALHRALWRWMAKHPGRSKGEWPGWEMDDYLHNAAEGENECFACSASMELYLATTRNVHICNFCPIRTKVGKCSHNDSLYRRIMSCEDLDRYKELCLQMAEAWPPVENN